MKYCFVNYNFKLNPTNDFLYIYGINVRNQFFNLYK